MLDIKNIIQKELLKLSLDLKDVVFEHPKVLAHGDYSCFIKDPSIKLTDLPLGNIKHEYIEKVSVIGRFINIHLSKKFFADSVKGILEAGTHVGKNKKLSGEKIIVEYTDPNLFKEFHIGHLMSNTVGESLARTLEWSGGGVKRACYQSDVGLNVAKAVWAMQKLSGEMPADTEKLKEKVAFLGKSYVYGSRAYEEDENFKKEIDALNKVIYEKSSTDVNKLYDWGREVSLKHFEEIFETLDTKFDYYFYESEAAPIGMFLVEEFLAKGIFEKSEGAIIFPGEKYDLHTRVFVNSQGLPTYETKELGLSKMKFDRADFDRSIVITANEQNDYFKVVLKALEFVNPTVANKTRHVSHGMMKFADGKMSSRAGNIVTGESMITDVEELVQEKIADRNLSVDEKKIIAEVVAIGAIKYSILKQSPGKDIIFDFEKSLSFEGDSGPYLQYSHARAHSVLLKAELEGLEQNFSSVSESIAEIEKLLYRFTEIVERAQESFEPQHITTYLTQIASAFNNFYANNQIVNPEEKESGYRIALTRAFTHVMHAGLHLLGIKAPNKM